MPEAGGASGGGGWRGRSLGEGSILALNHRWSFITTATRSDSRVYRFFPPCRTSDALKLKVRLKSALPRLFFTGLW